MTTGASDTHVAKRRGAPTPAPLGTKLALSIYLYYRSSGLRTWCCQYSKLVYSTTAVVYRHHAISVAPAHLQLAPTGAGADNGIDHNKN
jgi:hypothetical protein